MPSSLFPIPQVFVRKLLFSLFIAITALSLSSRELFAANASKPVSLLIQGEDFDGLEEFESWQTVAGRWYAKEHKSSIALGGSFAVANEFSIGSIMEKNLGQDLAPGTYNVWVRMFAWQDSDDVIEVDLNGAKATYECNPTTAKRVCRWLKGSVTTDKPGHTLKIKAIRVGQQNFGETPRPPCKFLGIDAIYIGDPSIPLTIHAQQKHDDLIIGKGTAKTSISKGKEDAQEASEEKRVDVSAGNLVQNGSFEAGLGYTWGSTSHEAVLSPTMLDSESPAAEGKTSLRTLLPSTGKVVSPLISRPYRVTPGTYTFSAFVRGGSSKSKNPKVTLAIMPVGGKGTKDKDPSILSKSFSLSDEWQRVSVTAEVTVPAIFLRIVGGDFWLDGVQLEKGDKMTAYKAHSSVEIGLLSDIPGKVYHPGEGEDIRLVVSSADSSAPEKAKVECRVMDIWDHMVFQTNLTVQVPHGKSVVLPLNPIPDRLGMFRAEVRAEEVPGSHSEMVFSVVPKLSPSDKGPVNWLGVMPEYRDYIMASFQRAGYQWTQNIRDPQSSRWMYAEKDQGKITWQDERNALPRKYGLEPVFLLHMNYNKLPKWVEPSTNKEIPKDVGLWKDYVSRVVEHYKGKIKYWQFSDDIHHFFNADEHAMLLKATAETVKKADPEAKFVGWRYFRSQVPGWETDFKRTEPYCDIVYNGDRIVREKYGKPIHNYVFFSADTMYGFPTEGDSVETETLARARRLNCQRIVKNFIGFADKIGIIGPMDALFFYMAYLGGTPPGALHISKNAFESTGELTIGAIIPRIVSHFLPRGDCLGKIKTSRNIEAYLFDRKDSSVVILWAVGGRQVKLVLKNPPEKLVCYDAMGNEIKTTVQNGILTLPLYDTPVFLVAHGVDPTRFKDLIASSNVPEDFPVFPLLALRDGKMYYDVNIRNNTDQTSSISVKVETPEFFPMAPDAATELSLGEVSSGSNKTVSFPLKYGLDRNAEFKSLDVEVKAGSATFRVPATLWLLNSRPAPVPTKSDGDLTEWQGTFPIKLVSTAASSSTRGQMQVKADAQLTEEEVTQRQASIIRGNQDISGHIYSRWDKENLYLACRVTDDKVEDGDKVELSIDTDPASDRLDSKMTPKVFRLTYEVGTSSPTIKLTKGGTEEVQSLPVGFRKNNDGYAVEVAIPWKSLGLTPKTGLILGFDATLTDMDDKSRHGQMVWAGASFDNDDPAGFGYMVLGQ